MKYVIIKHQFQKFLGVRFFESDLPQTKKLTLTQLAVLVVIAISFWLISFNARAEVPKEVETRITQVLRHFSFHFINGYSGLNSATKVKIQQALRESLTPLASGSQVSSLEQRTQSYILLAAEMIFAANEPPLALLHNPEFMAQYGEMKSVVQRAIENLNTPLQPVESKKRLITNGAGQPPKKKHRGKEEREKKNIEFVDLPYSSQYLNILPGQIGILLLKAAPPGKTYFKRSNKLDLYRNSKSDFFILDSSPVLDELEFGEYSIDQTGEEICNLFLVKAPDQALIVNFVGTHDTPLELLQHRLVRASEIKSLLERFKRKGIHLSEFGQYPEIVAYYYDSIAPLNPVQKDIEWNNHQPPLSIIQSNERYNVVFDGWSAKFDIGISRSAPGEKLRHYQYFLQLPGLEAPFEVWRPPVNRKEDFFILEIEGKKIIRHEVLSKENAYKNALDVLRKREEYFDLDRIKVYVHPEAIKLFPEVGTSNAGSAANVSVPAAALFGSIPVAAISTLGPAPAPAGLSASAKIPGASIPAVAASSKMPSQGAHLFTVSTVPATTAPSDAPMLDAPLTPQGPLIFEDLTKELELAYPFHNPPSSPKDLTGASTDVQIKEATQNTDIFHPEFFDSLFDKLGPPPLIAPQEVRGFKKIHYYIFDFNLDAIPAFIRARKRLIKYNVQGLSQADVEVTVIHPQTKVPKHFNVPQKVDKSIDEEILKELLGSGIKVTFLNQFDVKKSIKPPTDELSIYLGETVDCGSTSTLSVTKKYVDGSANDPATQYYLKNLEWIKNLIDPEVVISENHSFPSDVQDAIENVLNKGKSYGQKDFFHINIQQISHAHYSKEHRVRLYLVASKKYLSKGYPVLDGSNLPASTFEPSKSALRANFDQELTEADQDLKGQIQNYKADQLSPNQKLLLDSILKNYSSILRPGTNSSGYYLEVRQNKVFLTDGNKRYWLSIDRGPLYGLPHHGLVMLHEKSGEIRVVKRSFINDRAEPWILTRYWNDCQDRTCYTISSAESQGILQWGKKDRKLDPREVARVHGCSKNYSKAICKHLVDRNNQGYYNLPNNYIGHIYSTSVVSRLLLSILYQHFVPTSVEMKEFPSQYPPLRIDPALGDQLEVQLADRRTEGGQLIFNENEKSLSLVDDAGKALTPGMIWKELPTEETNELLATDSHRTEAEPVREQPEVPEILKALNLEVKSWLEKNAADQSILKMKETALFRHQKEGIHWFLSRRLEGVGGILADDMGLGKTLQAIGYIMAVKEASVRAEINPILPFLVVARPKLLPNWLDEFAKLVPKNHLKIRHFLACAEFEKENLLQTQTVQDLHVDVFLVNKTVIEDCPQHLQSLSFDSVIFDEAQDMRNSETNIAKNSLGLNSVYRFVLTGTPVENYIEDLWSQMHFIYPGFLGEKNEFRSKYPTFGKTAQALRAMFAPLKQKLAPYILRRTKKGLSKTDPYFRLPPKTPKNISISMSEDQKLVYAAVKKWTLQELQASGRKNPATAFARLTHLRKVCDHPAILNDEMKDWVINELKNTNQAHLTKEAFKTMSSAKMDETITFLEKRFREITDPDHPPRPVLIFSQFNEMINLLKRELDLRKIPTEKITGSTSVDQIAVISKRFNEGKIPVLLLNLKAGVGLNLQAADTSIFFEPWWNPQVENQAEDRIYRIGQKNPVTILKFYSQNTVEMSHILQKQLEKKGIFEAIFGTDEDFSVNENISDGDDGGVTLNAEDIDGILDELLAETGT